MGYKLHPFFDESKSSDWFGLLVSNKSELENSELTAIRTLLNTEKEVLCKLALETIQDAAGQRYLSERPYPEVQEFLFIPVGNDGYRVYIEYFFFQKEDENSPDSDIWWVIINCPRRLDKSVAWSQQNYVISFGWVVP